MKMAAWKSFRVLVVGDFMLDQALSGAAERALADLDTARLGHGVLPTARAAKT